MVHRQEIVLLHALNPEGQHEGVWIQEEMPGGTIYDPAFIQALGQGITAFES